MASLMPKILQHSWRPNDNAPPCASLFELTSACAPSVQHNCHGRAIRRSILSLSCLSECLVIDSRQDRRRGECAKFRTFLALAICPQLRSLSLRESELNSLAIRHPLTMTCPLSTRAAPVCKASKHPLHNTPSVRVRASLEFPDARPAGYRPTSSYVHRYRVPESSMRGMEFACSQELLRF